MKPLPLICLLTIVVLSCLEPNGENFVNIPHPDESTVTINLNNYSSGDTILIDAITNFTYKVSPEHWIKEASAKLDDHTLYVAYTQFQVNPLTYSKGVHRLFFQAIMSTNSRSLSDMISGGELMTVEREFIVIIDNDPPPAPNIQLDTLNGTVTLHWAKCDKKNFVSYVLTKYCGSPDDDYNPGTCNTETITDKTVTSWTDHQYVGRYARYRVEVATTLRSAVDELVLQWAPNLTTTVKDGYGTAHWRKPFFFANVTKVKVYDGPSKEIPVTETSFALPNRIGFGYQYAFKLDFVPATESLHRMWSNNYAVGTNHYSSAIPSLYHPVARTYYGYSYPSTIIMDEDLNVLKSITSNYLVRSLSDNGSYFITLVNDKFYYTDPYTLTTTLAYDPPEQSIGDFSVSDNGLLGYHNSSTVGYSVVDLNTGATKFNITWPWYVMVTCSLSPSGKYLSYGGSTIYENNGSTFVLKGQLDQYYYGFLFLDNDNILTYGDDFLKEYDINTLTVINTFDLGLDSYVVNVMQDPVTHKVVCSQAGRFFVVNTVTKKSYPVGGMSMLRLFNNTLFTVVNNYLVSSIDCSYVEQP